MIKKSKSSPTQNPTCQVLIISLNLLSHRSRSKATNLLTFFLHKSSIFTLQSQKNVQLRFTTINRINMYLTGSSLESVVSTLLSSSSLTGCYLKKNYKFFFCKVKPRYRNLNPVQPKILPVKS